MKIPTDRVARVLVDNLLSLPRPAAERLFGPPPTNDRGSPLDWQLHTLLSLKQWLGLPDLHEHELQEARETYERSCDIFDQPGPEMADVRDVQVPGPAGSIRIRLYRPTEADELPCCLYYHGGGFVIGTIEGYDGLCRHLADRAECVVASVEYRLAPEHPFPAAVDDGAAAYRWVRQHANELDLDSDRIVVAGDSAGGTIAAVTSQWALDHNFEPPHSQLLIYPKTDEGGPYPSREHFAEGFYLPRELLEWFTDHYLGEADFEGPSEDHPRISPIAYERPGDLPPTTVVTAGFDPLRDEGEAYADHLDDHGVRVVRHRLDHLIHGCINMSGVVDAASRAVADIAEMLRRELDKQSG
jgi:acetyl esterase